MAVKVFGNLDNQESNNQTSFKETNQVYTKINPHYEQIPASDQNIRYEVGYSFSIKHNDNELNFIVEPLKWRQMDDILAKVMVFNTIFENGLEKNLTPLLPDFAFYLSEMCKCLNPELVVSDSILNMLSFESQSEISDDDYKILFKYLMKSDLKDNEYSKYMLLSEKQQSKIFKKTILPNLRNTLPKHISTLAKYVYNKAISNIFYDVPITELITIISCIIEYNYIQPKKKVQNIMETISGNVTEAKTNYSSIYKKNIICKIDSGKPYLTIE